MPQITCHQNMSMEITANLHSAKTCHVGESPATLTLAFAVLALGLPLAVPVGLLTELLILSTSSSSSSLTSCLGGGAAATGEDFLAAFFDGLAGTLARAFSIIPMIWSFDAGYRETKKLHTVY